MGLQTALRQALVRTAAGAAERHNSIAADTTCRFLATQLLLKAAPGRWPHTHHGAGQAGQQVRRSPLFLNVCRAINGTGSQRGGSSSSGLPVRRVQTPTNLGAHVATVSRGVCFACSGRGSCGGRRGHRGDGRWPCGFREGDGAGQVQGDDRRDVRHHLPGGTSPEDAWVAATQMGLRTLWYSFWVGTQQQKYAARRYWTTWRRRTTRPRKKAA